jgi:acyl-CoA synthetase (AMP-forming)/AMP-acid ligase II
MNLSRLLSKTARLFPDKPAIIYGDRQSTYTQFNTRVNRLANALQRLGLRRGDNISILQYSYPETYESLFACFKGGWGAVPINFRLHPKEFAFIIDHSESRAIVLSPEFNQSIMEVRDRIPKAKHLITLKGASGELFDYTALITGESDRCDDVEVDPDDLAWLFYTSGTTGMPKGAMLTHRNLLAMTMNFYRMTSFYTPHPYPMVADFTAYPISVRERPTLFWHRSPSIRSWCYRPLKSTG